MNQSEGDLFSDKQQSIDKSSDPCIMKEKQRGKEVKAFPKEGIAVNKKLQLYLEKYINSFDRIHDKIELKGKLIDLIRKL